MKIKKDERHVGYEVKETNKGPIAGSIGVPVRAEFASHILPAIITSRPDWTLSDHCDLAMRYADALINRHNETTTEG